MAKVKGVRELRAVIRRAPRHLQEEVLKEVRASTKRMHRDAIKRFDTASRYAAFFHGGAGMRRVTGNVKRFYRQSVSKARLLGRVGLLSKKANQKAFYLRFFLYGTITQPARPVHDDAFEAERDTYIINQKRALKKALTKIFARRR